MHHSFAKTLTLVITLGAVSCASSSPELEPDVLPTEPQRPSNQASDDQSASPSDQATVGEAEPPELIESAQQPPPLPEPYATESVVNYPVVTGWPKDVEPTVPEGFEIVEFARSLDYPRPGARALERRCARDRGEDRVGAQLSQGRQEGARAGDVSQRGHERQPHHVAA